MPSPFRIPGFRAVPAPLLPALEGALALPRLERMYAGLPRVGDPRPFSEKALDALEVGWDVSPEDLARIPPSGPLLVVANHPFGGLDGLVLLALLARVRDDFKLLGNRLLGAIPDLRGALIQADPLGGPGSHGANVAAARSSLAWVREGGALGIFPGGEVSHLSLPSLQVTDPGWSPGAAWIARRARAPVVTVFFEGRNSRLFQLLGLAHPRLRTILLPRELLKSRGRRVRLRVGGPVPPERLGAFGTDAEATAYLRVRTCTLRRDPRRTLASRAVPGLLRRRRAPSRQPIAPGGPAAPLVREIAALPAAQRLVTSGSMAVHFARAGQIPSVLAEIGRLRETAFRAVGEGTGRSVDLDRFDEHYLHLFVWNEERSEIVGAYRIGPTDDIVPRLGVEGLYTSTLFRFSRPLLERLDPALEMGRSFVRPEYQKTHLALNLLWKGIGRFVADRPRYRRLFGPVSISNEYESMTRRLLIAFLQMNRSVKDLGRLLKPRHRVRFARMRDLDERLVGTVVTDLEDVESLIRDIEEDRRSMPVLLRQYLRLNGLLLGFNLDPEFGDVMDGLILVELDRVAPAILSRFMGRDGLAAFRAGRPAQSAGAPAVPPR